MSATPFKADLRLDWPAADPSAAPAPQPAMVDGRDNLVQALLLRLSVDRGELAGLAHARYGSRIYDLIGQPMDSANQELLRRYVREALKAEPRVKEILWVRVSASTVQPGLLEITAAVRDMADGQIELGMHLDVR
jgi:phage baseplate assembly protein W